MNQEEKLVPVFIPPLVTLLTELESQKGSPLTEAEVYEIRDNGVCMMMRESRALKMAKERGYNDLDPEQCWSQWLAFKQSKH